MKSKTADLVDQVALYNMIAEDYWGIGSGGAEKKRRLTLLGDGQMTITWVCFSGDFLIFGLTKMLFGIMCYFVWFLKQIQAHRLFLRLKPEVQYSTVTSLQYWVLIHCSCTPILWQWVKTISLAGSPFAWNIWRSLFLSVCLSFFLSYLKCSQEIGAQKIENSSRTRMHFKGILFFPKTITNMIVKLIVFVFVNDFYIEPCKLAGPEWVTSVTAICSPLRGAGGFCFAWGEEICSFELFRLFRMVGA